MLYADQMNLYAYVGNNPLNLNDPTGKVGQLARVALRAIQGAYYGGVSGAVAAQISGDGSITSTIAGTLSGAVAGAVAAQTTAKGNALAAAAGSIGGQLGVQMTENFIAGEEITSNLMLDIGAAAGAALGSELLAPASMFLNDHVGVLVGGRRETDGTINRGFATQNRALGRFLGAAVDGFGTGIGERLGAEATNRLEEAGVPATLQITNSTGELDPRFVNRLKDAER